MNRIRTSLAALALILAASSAALNEAKAQFYTSAQLAQIKAEQGVSRCPRGLEASQQMVRELTQVAVRTRAMADDNPLHEADAGFDAAELAWARSCAQSYAGRLAGTQ